MLKALPALSAMAWFCTIAVLYFPVEHVQYVCNFCYCWHYPRAEAWRQDRVSLRDETAREQLNWFGEMTRRHECHDPGMMTLQKGRKRILVQLSKTHTEVIRTLTTLDECYAAPNSSNVYFSGGQPTRRKPNSTIQMIWQECSFCFRYQRIQGRQ